jgi:Domain of unknown function (DUF2017)
MAEVSALPDGARGLHVTLEEVEVALLQSLARQLEDLVGPRIDPDADPLVALVGIDPVAQTPDDPALRRLLPDAYIDDEAAAGEFRRYTERDLRESKAGNARRVDAQLEEQGREVTISGDAIPAWLGFLNDTRLTIGTRLEISEENHDVLADLPDSDPRAGLFQVYDWLTFLQESIVQRLLPSP